MKQFDFLIIGQGIAGILIAHQLLEQGKSIFVIDFPSVNQSSKVAGAIINPYNLRTRKKSFNQDANHLEAIKTYAEISHILGTSIIEKKEMLLFKIEDEHTFPSVDLDEKDILKKTFHYKYAQKISPIFHINNQELIKNWIFNLQEKKIYEKSIFEFDQLHFLEDGIEYKQIKANNIIFCEGASAKDNTLFKDLPFNKNKGNALILNIPDLSESYIYQFQYRIIPIGNHHFWVGSNYQWDFDNLNPDMEWKNSCLTELQKTLKIPFHVIDYLAAERPTTAGQKVLMLQHQLYKNCYLFNGLGTKGFTIGPYYAKEFVERILN